MKCAEHGLIHCDFNVFNLMIDDDEKITMIDFPQMVSVSHRNAQMYFDRDVECVFKFFRKRLPKTLVFLDKELAASGFTRKDQEDIQRFIEGGVEENDSDTDEETEDDIFFSDTNEENIEGVDSLHLEDQSTSDFAEADELEDRQYCEVGQSSGPDTQNTIDETFPL
ncbi:hypothetical protein TIFTF001_039267 [Ficus carica]|uniref:non-specific serine/threonine protein kinase n=1 Tax=Ficus carica TaxID=3494 RepID=A0AA88E8T8_FICCA|nr:hypothetical protein TIFTF001_039267 [Ficus carica]